MGSADSRRRHPVRVGPHSTFVCGALRARSKGVTGAGTGAARSFERPRPFVMTRAHRSLEPHNRHGESRVEKPRGDDSVVDGSARDRAAGRPQNSSISDGLHESSALVNAPERGSKRAPPTSRESVLKPTGSRPGSPCVGKPRRSRREGCHPTYIVEASKLGSASTDRCKCSNI